MTQLLDITRDIRPRTAVKVGMAMARLPHGGELQVIVMEEALRSVVAALHTEGHRIESIGRREEVYLLRVEKGGGNAGWAEFSSSCSWDLPRVTQVLL
jgi:TusA-related sulfurtransferase